MRHSLTSTLLLASMLLLTSARFLVAQPPNSLQRLSAEFQNNTSLGGTGEVATIAPAAPGGAGGVVVYSKTVEIPNDVDVFYVTFSGQGDVHNGSALLMNATVAGALIQPLAGQTAGGGGGPHVQTGWYTLLHLPQATTGTNCNDGGGGTADCHDNTIYFSGCARLETHEKEVKSATVNIKLANLPGGDANVSFYERATIYIDGQKDEKGTLCRGVSTAPH